MEEFQKARAVSIFLSMPGREASTHDLVVDALKNGKSVFVPYIYDDGNGQEKQMDMLQLRDEDDLNSLKPDAWGIPSLGSDSIDQRINALGGIGVGIRNEKDVLAAPTLDMILMPAVAFDHSNHRLGHGKGFYDRYLARLNSVADRSSRRMPVLGRVSTCDRTFALTIPTVGFSLRQQLLSPTEHVPADQHDRDLDCVVTPDGVFGR